MAVTTFDFATGTSGWRVFDILTGTFQPAGPFFDAANQNIFTRDEDQGPEVPILATPSSIGGDRTDLIGGSFQFDWTNTNPTPRSSDVIDSVDIVIRANDGTFLSAAQPIPPTTANTGGVNNFELTAATFGVSEAQFQAVMSDLDFIGISADIRLNDEIMAIDNVIITQGPDTIAVTVDDDGDGTIENVLDGTIQTVNGVQNFVAEESPLEADTIELTDAVDRADIPTAIADLDDTASGTFTPAGGGPVVNFGPGEADQLSTILNGPDPVGEYEILDGDEGGRVGNITFDNFETIQFSVACFVRGTEISTRRGSVPIENLVVGDDVVTSDHGFQKIRWIGSTTVPADGKNAPIVFTKGSIGNVRDLCVSPQHRMLVRGWHVELMFDKREVLVPAKALVNDMTVFRRPGGMVQYFHMMFDQHELVFAEGVASESFHPGHEGLGSFANDARNEIFELFPALKDDVSSYSPVARPVLKYKEACALSVQSP